MIILITKRAVYLFVCLFLFLTSEGASRNTFQRFSQYDTEKEVHELTLYVIPSHLPLDWSSPATLYATTVKSWFSSLFHCHVYSLGHLFIHLSTPLLDDPVLTGIRSKSNMEKVKLHLLERVGLGIMGAAMRGSMETRNELESTMEHIIKERGEIAFITFRITKESAQRIVDFLKMFQSGSDDTGAPCNFYGGDFWPGYENEGSGCSALGLALMDAAGLNISRPEWKISVNVPEELVGGKFNKGHRVKNRDIKSSDRWHTGDGVPNEDYFHISMYDPTLIYNWIISRYEEYNHYVKGDGSNTDIIDSERYIMAVENGTPLSSLAPDYYTYEELFKGIGNNSVPGIYIDARYINIAEDKPLFIKRDKPSVFIDIHKQRLNSK
jgi:hypothetical protein